MSVVELVERERARLRVLDAAAWIGAAASATLVALLAGGWLLGDARWLALPRGTPLLVWLLLFAAWACILWLAARRTRRSLDRASVAATIEREQSLRAGALRGVMEVAGASAIARRADQSLGAALAKRPGLAPRTRRTAAMRAARGFGAAVLMLALLLWAAPAVSDGLLAIRSPIAAWRGTLLPPLRFRALPTALLRGESLDLELEAPGRRAVLLGVRATGEGWRTVRVAVDSASGIARAPLGAAGGDVRVFATDGRQRTDTMLVRVTDRPFVGGVQLRALYPAYLARASETLPVGEPARVPQGTVLELTGRASTTLTRVLLRGSADSVALETNAHTFAGRFRPARTDRWSWAAFGTSGAIADVPPPLDIAIVPDSAPRVDVNGAPSDTVLALTDRVALQVTATDDHGLASVELHGTRLSGGRQVPLAPERLADGEGTVWTGAPVIDLAAQSLGPGDALSVQVVAIDNSPWAQRGVSRAIVLRIPTMDERRDIARRSADSTAQEAVATAAAQQSLEQRTDEAARERGARDPRADAQSSPSAARSPDQASRDLSFESAEKARALAQQQRALAERVDRLRQSASALEQQLRRASALDSSLARQLREAQDLLRDALTPELMAQMQKLENASQNLSGNQARDALRDLADMQRRLQEQLERSAEMLKRAAIEGSMQTLSDEARDLAQRERALADSASRLDAGARRDSAQRMADQSSRLSSDVQQLQQRLAQQRADAAAGKTASAQRHADASSQSMRRQDASAAAQQMEQAANDIHDARQQQVGAWKQELTNALDESIQELLQMAQQESQLEQRARASQGDSSASGDMRAQQSALEQGVNRTNQRLQQEGQKSSLLSGRAQRAMSDAQQRVQQATRQVGDQRGGQQAGNALGEASDALNRAAAALARDRERANSASSATGFAEMLQQMQEMAKRQGSINAQAQGLMPIPGATMSAEAQATARMLAQQQRQIANQLDELGEGAGGDRAGELAKEARRLADAMEQTHVDAGTLARQQQLFRRLLDAGRSLERDDRDDTGKREAHAATGDQRFDPGQDAVNGKSAVRFREPTWNELRGLSDDDRRAILEYFKRINAEKP